MFNRMLFDDFRRSFDRLLEGFGSSRAICSEVPFAWTFAPAVETGWTESHFNLRLIVPGVTENDLKSLSRAINSTSRVSARSPRS